MKQLGSLKDLREEFLHETLFDEKPVSLAGREFFARGPYVAEALQLVQNRHSKAQSIVGENKLFHLPLGALAAIPKEQQPWLRATLMALNMLYGIGQNWSKSAYALQKKVLAQIGEMVGRVCSWQQQVPLGSFKSFFDIRGGGL